MPRSFLEARAVRRPLARLTVLRCTLGGSLFGFTFGPSGRLRLPRAAAKDSGTHELT
jgi:hypothetical protein